MLRSVRFALAASVVLAAPLAPAFATETAAAPVAAPAPPNISVLPAQSREIVATLSVTGTLTPRETVTVETPWGSVPVKVARLGGAVANAAPEFDACAAIARAHGVAVKDVQAAAMKAWLDRA